MGVGRAHLSQKVGCSRAFFNFPCQIDLFDYFPPSTRLRATFGLTVTFTHARVSKNPHPPKIATRPIVPTSKKAEISEKVSKTLEHLFFAQSVSQSKTRLGKTGRRNSSHKIRDRATLHCTVCTLYSISLCRATAAALHWSFIAMHIPPCSCSCLHFHVSAIRYPLAAFFHDVPVPVSLPPPPPPLKTESHTHPSGKGSLLAKDLVIPMLNRSALITYILHTRAKENRKKIATETVLPHSQKLNSTHTHTNKRNGKDVDIGTTAKRKQKEKRKNRCVGVGAFAISIAVETLPNSLTRTFAHPPATLLFSTFRPFDLSTLAFAKVRGEKCLCMSRI